MLEIILLTVSTISCTSTFHTTYFVTKPHIAKLIVEVYSCSCHWKNTLRGQSSFSLLE